MTENNNNKWITIIDDHVVGRKIKMKRYPTAPIFTKKELRQFNNFETSLDVAFAGDVLHDELQILLRKIMYLEKMVNKNEYTAVQFEKINCSVILQERQQEPQEQEVQQ
jgi:hypothetical protein